MISGELFPGLPLSDPGRRRAVAGDDVDEDGEINRHSSASRNVPLELRAGHTSSPVPSRPAGTLLLNNVTNF